MMNCIKTGLTLYVSSTNQYTRVDLFFDGTDLYVNKNKYFDGIPSDLEAECLTLDIGDKYDKLNYPKFNTSVIEYVSDMVYKGWAEELFLKRFQ